MEPGTLADVLVVVHALYAGFVVCGFAAVIAGGTLGWGWVRQRGFRQLHAGAMLFVGAEALIGMACPLTLWEGALRARAGDAPQEGAFIARFAARLLYYDLPPWSFTSGYLALSLLVLLLWRWVPPRRRGARGGGGWGA